MDLDPSIRREWHETHRLSRESCHWIAAHADVGDLHPIMTAVDLLRADDHSPR